MTALRRALLILALLTLLASILLLFSPSLPTRENIRLAGVIALVVVVIVGLWEILFNQRRRTNEGVFSGWGGGSYPPPSPKKPKFPPDDPRPVDSGRAKKQFKKSRRKTSSIEMGVDELKERARRRAEKHDDLGGDDV